MAGPFYLEPAVGNDGNAGTAWGAGNSWATLQKAFDTAAAGEIVYCKGTDILGATIDCDINSGDTVSGPIKFIGVNNDGNNDGTRFTIDGNAAATYCLNAAASMNYIYMENFNFTGATSHGLYMIGNSAAFWAFNNCAFYSNGANGAYTYRGINSIFVRCAFYSNTTDGLFMAISGQQLFFCSFHNNTGSGLYCSAGGVAILIGCLIYSNGDDGVSALEDNIALFNCVVDNNTDNGIDFEASEGRRTIIGCRVTNHSGAGDIGINVAGQMIVHGWNYFEDNDGANIQAATIDDFELLYNGATTDIEDQANTNEGYTTAGSDFNLRSDASLRRQAISIPLT